MASMLFRRLTGPRRPMAVAVTRLVQWQQQRRARARGFPPSLPIPLSVSTCCSLTLLCPLREKTGAWPCLSVVTWDSPCPSFLQAGHPPFWGHSAVCLCLFFLFAVSPHAAFHPSTPSLLRPEDCDSSEPSFLSSRPHGWDRLSSDPEASLWSAQPTGPSFCIWGVPCP